MTTNKYKLPNGCTLRPATWDDLQACVDLTNDAEEHQIGIRSAKIEEVKAEWESPNFTLDSNTRVVANQDNRLVGYIELWDTVDPPVDMWVWARVHPEFEGQGIGTAMMLWAEGRAREVLPRCPAGSQVSIISGTVSTYEPSKKLLEGLEMKLNRQFWEMHIDINGSPLPSPQWPAGITIRTYRHDEDLRALAIADDDAFKDHYGYVARDIEEEMKRLGHWFESNPKNDASMWYLAMDGEEIAGICLCKQSSWEGDEIGHVSSLAVRRPWRKKGLALALLHHSFAEFYRRGKKGVDLGVDAGSLTGATRLYERAGMSVKRRFDDYTKIIRAGKDLARRK